MDDGNTRQRRSTTKNIATLAFSIPMTNAQFQTFKAWVRDTLVDGTLQFTAPIWDGSAHTTKNCTFTAPYKDSMTADSLHVVSVSLDVEDW